MKKFIFEREEKILCRAQVNPATKGSQKSSLQPETPYHPVATNIKAKKQEKQKAARHGKNRASPSINTENRVFEIPNATGIPSHGIIMRGS
ncbi:hypothetical protein N7517_008342 [Penicillium concentricum]|uniref:Uncharacterized protein n=1 Tax=Penicillium concentricum TaxID=293559 RepID=A0A9W9V418_9EURO|nr:uncharacterized protein N7517_008342 [Penicillium concentricum]KAJ5365456.1 hypothetical protein N7517_008342 [Penicillium concentricum]